jgi:hypothetical protein
MLSSSVGYIVTLAVSLITTPLLLHELRETVYGLQSLVAVINEFTPVVSGYKSNKFNWLSGDDSIN